MFLISYEVDFWWNLEPTWAPKCFQNWAKMEQISNQFVYRFLWCFLMDVGTIFQWFGGWRQHGRCHESYGPADTKYTFSLFNIGDVGLIWGLIFYWFLFDFWCLLQKLNLKFHRPSQCFVDFSHTSHVRFSRAFWIQKTYQKLFQNEIGIVKKSMPKTIRFSIQFFGASGSNFGALGCVRGGPERPKSVPRASQDGPKSWGHLSCERFVTLLGALGPIFSIFGNFGWILVEFWTIFAMKNFATIGTTARCWRG